MGLLYIPGAPDATRKTPFSQNFRLCRLPKSPPRGKLSLAFFREVYYTIPTCRCDGMVDVVDSKTSSPSVAGVGKSLRQSSVFQIRFFICLSHPSCVSLQIPGNACPGVKKYICRCVGIGRRGGLKNHFAICRRCWEKSWKIKRFSDSVFHLSLTSLLHIPPNSGECLSGC